MMCHCVAIIIHEAEEKNVLVLAVAICDLSFFRCYFEVAFHAKRK